ncbi:MAG: hypothetical protein NVSMB68_12220 [Thermoanaerobaculia bacterium]
MYNLTTFGYREMMECRAAMRALFNDEPSSVGDGAGRIVRFLFESLTDEEGKPACALARMFKTHRYDALDPELRHFARGMFPEADTVRDLRCLVLLASAGQEPSWNSRHKSRGHKCIPLVSEKMVEEAPMIAQLIKQIGLKISNVLQPDPALMLDHKQASYNVFYVPDADGSPFIVAQDEFVRRYKVASVIGFGGLASAGDLIATILFSKVRISAEVAELFKVIGLNARIAMLPVLRKPLFE